VAQPWVPGEQSAVQAGQSQQKPLRVPTRDPPSKVSRGQVRPGCEGRAAKAGTLAVANIAVRFARWTRSRWITDLNLCSAEPGITRISLSRWH